MNSAEKSIQLNTNNMNKQALKKAEEKRAAQNIQALINGNKELKEIKREQDT